MEEASWRSHHGGGITERGIIEGGIMEEASGGVIMEEASWSTGGGVMEEWRRSMSPSTVEHNEFSRAPARRRPREGFTSH